MSKEEEVKKIWKTFTDKRGMAKFQPKDLLNLIDLLAGKKTHLHSIQIIQLPGVSMIVNSLNKKHPPDKTMYVKGLNTLAKHIKEKYHKEEVKENNDMYKGKYEATYPSARYTEFVPVEIPDSYSSNGIMKLAKNWLDKYGANGYSYFDKPHYAGMPKDIVSKLTREEIEVIQHYWPKHNLDEVRGIHSHGITPEKVSYKVNLPSEYPYSSSGRYSVVLMQAKRWLDKYGTNGYEEFDYPEYAGMPDNIANKLSSDEVDFIQTYWPGMHGEVGIEDSEILRTDEGNMLPKVPLQKSQQDYYKQDDREKTLTGPDAKAAEAQLKLARKFGGWNNVPAEEKARLKAAGLLGESVNEANQPGNTGSQLTGAFNSMASGFSDGKLAKAIVYFMQGRHQEGRQFISTALMNVDRTVADKIISQLESLPKLKQGIDPNTDKASQDYINNKVIPWIKNTIQNSAKNVSEAKYQGREVPLGKPMQGDVKKKKVYVKKPNGKVVKVNFGDKKMRIKKSNPKRRKSFRARHNCKNPGPRWKARYWSCRSW